MTFAFIRTVGPERLEVCSVPARSVKVDDLRGSALEWAVAQAEGVPVWLPGGNVYPHRVRLQSNASTNYNPSTNPAQGQPIMERERISVFEHGFDGKWRASIRVSLTTRVLADGDTQLQAAMRARVAQVFGESIEVPLTLET